MFFQYVKELFKVVFLSVCLIRYKYNHNIVILKQYLDFISKYCEFRTILNNIFMKASDVVQIRSKLKLTQDEFGKLIGVSKNTIYNWENGNKIPDSKILMLENLIHTGKEKLKDFDYEEESFKKEPTGYYLPDVYAAANMEDEMQNQDELNRIPVNIPNWEKNTIFINVSGDSMYPEYNSGDIIGIKETEFDYIVFGFAYVVILMNGDVYVKYIKKGVDKEHIILESENEFYEPKEIHLSKVKKVYQVKGVITKKSM